MAAQGNKARGKPNSTARERIWTTLFLLGGVAGLAALLTGPWFPQANHLSQLEEVLSSNQLIVTTRNSPATFYFDTNGYTGLEYELAKRFADSLNVELVIEPSRSFTDLLPKLISGTAHIAASSISITPERERLVRFGPAYKQVTQQVIYRGGQKKPREIADLNDGKLTVLAGSSYAESVRYLARTHPDLQWQEVGDADVEALLEAVSEGTIDYTILDSNLFEVYRRFYPTLRTGLTLSEPQSIAWAFPPGQDNSLLSEAARFFDTLKSSGELETLISRHYQYVRNYDQVSTHYYLRHIDERLPKLRPLFQQAGEAQDLDWRLLAAIGYQESHWDPSAVSPTGVKGIMMLTSATASQLGLENREDPEQSILGGARYFKMMRAKIPERIQNPDRTWLALAAYNIGYGHLEDARVLTQRRGGNPDRWLDVRQSLPLLSQKSWYTQTRYGYARGREPVQYVQQIRSYLDILKWVDSRPKRNIVNRAPAGSADVSPAPPP